MRLPLKLSTFIAGSFAAVVLIGSASAQSRPDVLTAVGEEGPSTLDTHNPVANNYSRLISWHVYDRLVTHGTKTLESGATHYDLGKVEPELAESWEISEDGTEMIFNLREDAVFHDGSPVEAKDVKWSFDRAVSAGGFAAIQMGAGSLLEPEQFEAVDTHTFKITVPDGNKLALPDLTTPIAIVINSDLALEHATDDDPWAMDWLRNNTAGGGAYDVVRWNPGNEIVFQRFDDWKSGQMPAIKTVVYRQIDSAGTRRALLERGDADISISLPPKDFSELAENPNFEVVGVPKQSSLVYLELNTGMPPLNNPKVREAIAYAIPYQDILESAYFNRASAMFGAETGTDYAAAWPVRSPYVTDLEKAKQLLTEAGYPDGFESQIFFDISRGTTREPVALMIQENLGKIGITTNVEKVPGANWFSKMLDKSMPMIITSFQAWLDWPDYHFYWTYHGGNNSVFNAADYTSEEMDALIDSAMIETDTEAYEDDIRGMIDIAMKDLPKIPLVQDYLDVAMQPDVDGYVYWFHSLLDFRSLSK